MCGDMKKIKYIAAALLAVSAVCASVFAAGKPKALVVMLDGMRADAVENASVPAIRKLMAGEWAEGYGCAWSLDANTVREARPSSAANHCAIATAVTPAKTRVFSNGQTKHGAFDKWPGWTRRIASSVPGAKTAFAYSWGEDGGIDAGPGVEFRHSTDAKIADWVESALKQPGGPDAMLWFIDQPDHGGHAEGFYPYSHMYLRNVHVSDTYIGRALDAIKSRPSFAEEDWLVIVTSDHGGYGRVHGIWGGHCTTIPYIVAGKGIASGRIPGSPSNYDAGAEVLAHFGIDPEKLELDGKTLAKRGAAVPAQRAGASAPAIARPAAQLVFQKGKASAVSVAAGLKAVSSNGFTTLEGSENLAYANGDNFAVAFWAKMPRAVEKDPAIASNKDWTSGANDGIAIVAGKATDRVKTPGVCLNAAIDDSRKRIDMGTFDIEDGKWTFYAATKEADGTLSFYQGREDGRLYWMSMPAAGLKTASGLPWRIGQDGTGKYAAPFKGELREFALWTEGLPRDAVRRIFEAGWNGVALDELR